MKEFNLKEIHQKYYGKIKGVFVRYFNDEVSENMTQECFLSIFNDLPKIKNLEECYKKYALDFVVNYIEKNNNEFKSLNKDYYNANACFESSLGYCEFESFYLVERLNTLTNAERWILNMRLVEEFGFDKISKITSLTEEKCNIIFDNSMKRFKSAVLN
jgi:hypothetical protein